METRHDLRREMSVIVTQANALMDALLALPETEEATQAAIDALSPEERGQLAEAMTVLAQRAGAIRQQSLWIKHYLVQGVP